MTPLAPDPEAAEFVVLAAGLTPAWQRVHVLDGLAVGEVNRSCRTLACASGKAVNVALAAQYAGALAHAVVPVGGVVGEWIRDDLERSGLRICAVGVKAMSRTCTTLVDAHARLTTEVVEEGGALDEIEIEAFRREFRDMAAHAAVVVLTGSLPHGVPAALYRDLMDGLSCPVVVDARGPELVSCLSRRPFVVKPNREELARTVGRPLPSEVAVAEAMEELRQAGAEWVVTSDGSGDLLALGPKGLHRLPTRPVSVVNPIGCGDCLAAGIAVGLARGESVLDGLELGRCLASENAATLLPARFSKGAFS